jgi:hypothetical protein
MRQLGVEVDLCHDARHEFLRLKQSVEVLDEAMAIASSST